MAKRRISNSDGLRALERYLSEPNEVDLATISRFLLEELAEKAPGNTVEVRVPPYGAIQCIEGPRHSRGTPPNVVEMRPETWVDIALGKISWAEAVADSLVSASGVRADLAEVLPLKIRGLD